MYLGYASLHFLQFMRLKNLGYLQEAMCRLGIIQRNNPYIYSEKRII